MILITGHSLAARPICHFPISMRQDEPFPTDYFQLFPEKQKLLRIISEPKKSAVTAEID